MGAWGAGSFDNDGPLDWLDQAFGPGEVPAVQAALRATAEAPEESYLDVDDASAAVAAARDGSLSGPAG